MALPHPMSCECGKSELDLFSLPPTQTTIESSQSIEYRPIATLTDDSPIEFLISGSADEYVDLSETYVRLTVRLKKSNGADLVTKDEAEAWGADKIIGPVNNWLHSLFCQVDMDLNGVLTTSSTNTYPYRAYLENLLSYGKDASDSQLALGMWYKDTAGKFNSLQEDNLGFNARLLRIANSNKATMYGRPHLDLCFQDKLLLNGVDIKLRFVRSKDAFSVMRGGIVKIEDMSLFVRKVKVNSHFQLEHIKGLEKTTAKYPIKRVETKAYSIPQGHLRYVQENLFLGQRPKRIILGMVKNSAFNGYSDENPFEFKHYSTNFVALYIDGVQVPSKAYKPNFANRLYDRCYVSLFESLGITNKNVGIDISYTDYLNGYTLFGFDLTPDLDHSGHFHLVKEGNVRLELNFETALPETVNLIVYAEFDNIIEIDKARNVHFDYTS